jgi:hypothetical protein
VATGSAPVGERLVSEGDKDVEIFGKSMEQVAGHPHVITHGDTEAGANLEFHWPGITIVLMTEILTQA